jgi:molybdopterin/thiamine biosynthesis adenylyltransferase
MILNLLLVGLGGNGWTLMRKLMSWEHVRVAVIEPDKIESSNLPRLVGTTDRHVGFYKTEAFEAVFGYRFLKKIQSKVQDCTENFQDYQVVVACVDNNETRQYLAMAGLHFKVPLFDLGAGIVLRNGQIVFKGGQIRIQLPGEECLFCLGLPLPISDRKKALCRAAGYLETEDPQEEIHWNRGEEILAINEALVELALPEILTYLDKGTVSSKYIRLDLIQNQREFIQSTVVPNCICQVEKQNKVYIS